MISSRGTFLLGSVSTLALAGCGGAGSSPTRNMLPLGTGGISASSIPVRYIRKNPLQPIARFDEMLRAAHPAGSRIYYYGTYVVQDGNDYGLFPQSSTVAHDATGLHVYNDISGTVRAFSRLATVTLLADAGEAVISPNEALNSYLESRIKSGHAHFAGTTSGGDTSASRGAMYMMLQPDDGDGGGGGGGGAGHIPPAGNHITSLHNECTSGGENIGVSYTVPEEYSENVTVTVCVDNGAPGGNVCVPFSDQVPGSTHNVSIWIPGSGPPAVSMGVVSKTGTREGVGWGSLNGC